MRLLDTTTGQFVSKDPNDPETRYTILSHTWNSEGEQTIHQLREIQKPVGLELELWIELGGLYMRILEGTRLKLHTT